MDDSIEKNKDIIANLKVNLKDFELLKFLSGGGFDDLYIEK